MSENEKTEGQRGTVAFFAGLLIGGLLVWVFFGGDRADTDLTDTDNGEIVENGEEDENGEMLIPNGEEGTTPTTPVSDTEDNEITTPTPETRPTLPTGDGSVSISDQPASSLVEFDAITFPVDNGWIGIRTYQNGQLQNILGVARFSKDEGLIPEAVQLLTPTISGQEYAVVFFDGPGREFNLANHPQIDGIFATFVAQ